MTATFGTPIAAILLAVELLLFEWKPRSFVPVAVASVVAATWRSWSLGTAALFPLATGDVLPQKRGLLLCVALGIGAGLASGTADGNGLWRRGSLPALAVALDVVAIDRRRRHRRRRLLIEPHRSQRVGYDNITALLHGDVSSDAALRWLIVKAVIWSVALGSGTSGGVLAPLAHHAAASWGSLFGAHVSPGDTGMWALVGMAAMMGGTMRSPLTAMMFGLELTHDLNALLPLAYIGCAAAHLTTVLLLKRSILDGEGRPRREATTSRASTSSIRSRRYGSATSWRTPPRRFPPIGLLMRR